MQRGKEKLPEVTKRVSVRAGNRPQNAVPSCNHWRALRFLQPFALFYACRTGTVGGLPQGWGRGPSPQLG